MTLARQLVRTWIGVELTSRRAFLQRSSAAAALVTLPSLVASGQVWLLATDTPRSWDSRYFGPVPLDQVRLARPLMTIGGGR